MTDMYGNYSKAERTNDFDVLKALEAINVGFTLEMEKRYPEDKDPAFGIASAIYLHKVFGDETVKAVLSSPMIYSLAFNLCAVVAGKNTSDMEDFHDLCASIHNFAKLHPEMIREIDTSEFQEDEE